MRLPIPLMLAAAVAVGAVVTMLIQVNILVLGSWDDRWEAFNGTHVIRNIYASRPTLLFTTLYLGYGTAYFQNPVNVYFLLSVKSPNVRASDLGRYLPIRVFIESGSLPTNTYIAWTDPYSGATRKLYFVSGTNRAYVLGTYSTNTNVAIPVYYVVEGSQVRLYPMSRFDVSTTEACNVISNAGLITPANNYIYAVLDDSDYICGGSGWELVTVGWTQVASSVTSAALYPSPRYYKVTVASGSNTLTIFLSYWYVVNADPGFFAVKPG